MSYIKTLKEKIATELRTYWVSTGNQWTTTTVDIDTFGKARFFIKQENRLFEISVREVKN